MLEEDEDEDSGGGHCCRWLDCGAVFGPREDLVKHIEKVHVDQRKGEDFSCFWAACPRKHKPFNARYKLLIHMRVHSGEKPNKCSVSHRSFIDQLMYTFRLQQTKNIKHTQLYIIFWKV